MRNGIISTRNTNFPDPATRVKTEYYWKAGVWNRNRNWNRNRLESVGPGGIGIGIDSHQNSTDSDSGKQKITQLRILSKKEKENE